MIHLVVSPCCRLPPYLFLIQIYPNDAIDQQIKICSAETWMCITSNMADIHTIFMLYVKFDIFIDFIPKVNMQHLVALFPL